MHHCCHPCCHCHGSVSPSSTRPPFPALAAVASSSLLSSSSSLSSSTFLVAVVAIVFSLLALLISFSHSMIPDATLARFWILPLLSELRLRARYIGRPALLKAPPTPYNQMTLLLASRWPLGTNVLLQYLLMLVTRLLTNIQLYSSDNMPSGCLVG